MHAPVQAGDYHNRRWKETEEALHTVKALYMVPLTLANNKSDKCQLQLAKEFHLSCQKKNNKHMYNYVYTLPMSIFKIMRSVTAFIPSQSYFTFIPLHTNKSIMHNHPNQTLHNLTTPLHTTPPILVCMYSVLDPHSLFS